MPVGAAIGVVGIAGAGASVLAADAQSDAAEDAVQAQTEAAASSDATSLAIYEDQAARQEPFRQLGLAAINPFADLLGLDYNYNEAQTAAPQTQQPAQPISYGGYSSGGGVNGFNGYSGGGFTSRAANEIFQNNPDLFQQSGGNPYLNQGQGPQIPNIVANGQGGYSQGGLPQQQLLTNAQPTAAPELTQEQRTQNAFNTLESRPGYQFQLSQGVGALDQSAASRGMLLSGAQQRALTQYGQDYGSNAYDQELNRLSVAMGGGQVATQAVNSSAAAYGAQTSANAINLGDARASAYQQQGQASANAFNGIGGSISGAVGTYAGAQGWI